MSTRRLRRLISSLSASLILHFVLLMVAFLIVSDENAGDSSSSIQVDLMRSKKVKAPRAPVYKHAIKPISRVRSAIPAPRRMEANFDLPETYVQLPATGEYTGLHSPTVVTSGMMDRELLRPDFQSVTMPEIRGSQKPITLPIPDLRPKLDDITPGMEDFLKAEQPEVQITVEDLSRLVSLIRKKIESAKRYPVDARRARLEGKTLIGFLVMQDGSIGHIEILESSGHRLLDEAAVETIRRAAPFPPLQNFTSRRSLFVEAPITFKLREDDS